MHNRQRFGGWGGVVGTCLHQGVCVPAEVYVVTCAHQCQGLCLRRMRASGNSTNWKGFASWGNKLIYGRIFYNHLNGTPLTCWWAEQTKWRFQRHTVFVGYTHIAARARNVQLVLRVFSYHCTRQRTLLLFKILPCHCRHTAPPSSSRATQRPLHGRGCRWIPLPPQLPILPYSLNPTVTCAHVSSASRLSSSGCSGSESSKRQVRLTQPILPYSSLIWAQMRQSYIYPFRRQAEIQKIPTVSLPVNLFL